MNYTFLVDFQAMESGWNFAWVFRARVEITLFLRPPHWVQGGPITSLPRFTSSLFLVAFVLPCMSVTLVSSLVIPLFFQVDLGFSPYL